MNSPRLRLGRCSIPDNTYILTMVCQGRRRWFEQDQSARVMMAQFPELDELRLSHSLAWVVMPDHVHWLLQLHDYPLSHVAQRIKSRSALLLNRLHGRTGKLWQSGFHDHGVRSDASLRGHAMYILANPVRAGLAARIGEYPHAWCRWPVDGT